MSNSPLSYTRAVLALWARWARLTGLGYPSSSAFVFKARGRGQMPAEAECIDQTFLLLQRDPVELQNAYIVRFHYLEEKNFSEKLAALEVSKSTYYRRLDDAQWAVHVRLTR